jgi:antitoxin component YwqK of YwqJK toxin-antitoxin module
MVIFHGKDISKMKNIMNLNNIVNKIKSISPNIKFIGSFDENNKKTGYWEEYYNNGKIYSKGYYLNGERHGYWEKYWYHGILWMKGNFKDGIKVGLLEIFHSDGEPLRT